MTKIIGITGIIASGKTFACSYLKKQGYKVFESDNEVQKILKKESILKKLKENFRDCFDKSALNKNKIANIVFVDKDKLQQLEDIIHPEVLKERDKFLKDNKNDKMVFIDAPLLYEVGYDFICDKVILIYTDKEMRKKRALSREGMTEEKLDIIIANQISEEDKKLKADYLIYSQDDENDTIKQIETILLKIK